MNIKCNGPGKNVWKTSSIITTFKKNQYRVQNYQYQTLKQSKTSLIKRNNHIRIRFGKSYGRSFLLVWRELSVNYTLIRG